MNRRIYITSDWHLNHANVIKYDDRPKNYQDLILNNFKEMVKEDDLVINLGDVIFKSPASLKLFMEQLNGEYWLTMGNHDKSRPGWFKNKGFSKVFRVIVVGDIVFSHWPIDMDKYPDQRINIHGHVHQDRSIEELRNVHPFYDERNLNLSIDEQDYKPVLLEEFLERRGFKIDELICEGDLNI